jgi:CheY-like chemotaxis protein
MYGKTEIKILVAEDNAINIQVAKYILSTISTKIDFVLNGEDAVNHFLNQHYDLILMDVKMPVMDGYEATIKIRQIESEQALGNRIPIIAMTASSMYDEAQACLEAGMDGFLSKPYSVDDVKNILKSIDQQSHNNNK